MPLRRLISRSLLAISVAQSNCASSRRPAKTRSLLEVLGEMRAVDQQLFRHAADVHAGTAQVAALRHRHFRAEAGRKPRRPHTAGTGANHIKVKIVGHFQSPRQVTSIPADSRGSKVALKCLGRGTNRRSEACPRTRRCGSICKTVSSFFAGKPGSYRRSRRCGAFFCDKPGHRKRVYFSAQKTNAPNKSGVFIQAFISLMTAGEVRFSNKRTRGTISKPCPSCRSSRSRSWSRRCSLRRRRSRNACP